MKNGMSVRRILYLNESINTSQKGERIRLTIRFIDLCENTDLRISNLRFSKSVRIVESTNEKFIGSLTLIKLTLIKDTISLVADKKSKQRLERSSPKLSKETNIALVEFSHQNMLQRSKTTG